MALYIVYEDKQERTWHVGQVPPDGWLQVKYIQADGDELEHIRNQYSLTYYPPPSSGAQNHITYNIPIPCNQRVVRWYGDIAKIIIGNL